MSPPIPISIIILTRNEEINLSSCLDSVAGFADVHILDSGSTDRTVEIAKNRGIGVFHHSFEAFGTQRNWAIDNLPTAHDWHFHLDADERMTPALATELAAIAAADPLVGGYRVPSKLIFAGKWLRRAGQYPGYQVRFFHKARVRFSDFGHGQREKSEFLIGTLNEPLIHYGFSKGLDDWFVKHVRYARREAEQAIKRSSVHQRLFIRDGTERRRALKEFALRLPARYLFRLGYMLIWRMAILDGWAGVTYAHMVATYEGMIEVYLRVLSHGVDRDRHALLDSTPSIPVGSVQK